jgi:hypothetical protein
MKSYRLSRFGETAVRRMSLTGIITTKSKEEQSWNQELTM